MMGDVGLTGALIEGSGRTKYGNIESGLQSLPPLRAQASILVKERLPSAPPWPVRGIAHKTLPYPQPSYARTPAAPVCVRVRRPATALPPGGGLRRLDALTDVVVVNLEARLANDLDAFFALGPVAMIAHQRTDAPSLAPHRIERIDAGKLHVELSPGTVIEQCERPARGCVPFRRRACCRAVLRKESSARPRQDRRGQARQWRSDRHVAFSRHNRVFRE
jgi:hypothetical protein